MISKWKYSYTDEEKDMALTIQNLKQEIDKLVDTIEDVNREFSQYKYENKKEIERLNNIINELEKWLEERLEKLDIYGYDDDIFNGIELALQKLQELKGSDKE